LTTRGRPNGSKTKKRAFPAKARQAASARWEKLREMNAVMAATKAKPNCALPVDSQCRLVHGVAALRKHSQESFHSAASSVAYVVCFVVVLLTQDVLNIICMQNGVTVHAVKKSWTNFKAGKLEVNVAKKLPVEYKPRAEMLGEWMYQVIGGRIYDMERKGENITSTTVRNMFEKHIPQLKDIGDSSIIRIMQKLG